MCKSLRYFIIFRYLYIFFLECQLKILVCIQTFLLPLIVIIQRGFCMHKESDNSRYDLISISLILRKY